MERKGERRKRKTQHSENVHTQCKTYLHSMYINLAAASTGYISEFRSRRGEHLAAKFQVAGKYKSKGVNPILKIGKAIAKSTPGLPEMYPQLNATFQATCFIAQIFSQEQAMIITTV